MRTLSFIVAFGFIFAGPCFTTSAGSSLPGIGTFSYGGTPADTHFAYLTLTKRTRA